jgi:hypothetical protein
MTTDFNAAVYREIVAALEQFNEQLPEGQTLSISNETTLGIRSGIGSLSLITIFTLVEERISERFGIELALLEEEELLTEGGPLESLDRFAEFIGRLLKRSGVATA